MSVLCIAKSSGHAYDINLFPWINEGNNGWIPNGPENNFNVTYLKLIFKPLLSFRYSTMANNIETDISGLSV